MKFTNILPTLPRVKIIFTLVPTQTRLSEKMDQNPQAVAPKELNMKTKF